VKLSEIETHVVEGYSPDVVPRLYKLMKISGRKLSGGNCGMSAYAIYQFCKDRLKLTLRLGLISNGDHRQLCDISAQDGNVYHVFVQHGGQFYDETGSINSAYLTNLAKSQYQDSNPEFWHSIDPEKDTCINPIIRNDTDWDTSWQDFYRVLEKHFKVQ